MIIAFSGLDGSGKTTHAKKTMNYLLNNNQKIIYRHAIKSSLSEFIAENIKRISIKTKEKLEKKLRSKRKKNILLTSGKKITLLYDLILFNIKYYGLKGKTNKHIICDRYFYDELVQAKYLSLGKNLFFRIYKNLIIQPDIIFYIHINPKIAFKRKPEYEFKYYKKKYLLYNSIKNLPSIVILKNNKIPLIQKEIEININKILKNKKYTPL